MPYSTRTDVERIFGVDNVTSWADLDNTRVAATITARIDYMITDADNEIDAMLRDGIHKIPFVDDGQTPINFDQVLITLSARLTGVKLYEARGITDDEETNHDLTSHRKMVDMIIRKLNAGLIRLTHDKAKILPASGWVE